MSAPDLGEWADRYEDNHWFRAITDAISRDEELTDRTRVAGGNPRLSDARKTQKVMEAIAGMGGMVDSDSYRKLSVPERFQADAIALALQNGCGAYVGSDTDALTDAAGIVLAARFAPPLGDNHHNAAACPYCTVEPRTVRPDTEKEIREALLEDTSWCDDFGESTLTEMTRRVAAIVAGSESERTARAVARVRRAVPVCRCEGTGGRGWIGDIHSGMPAEPCEVCWPRDEHGFRSLHISVAERLFPKVTPR